jgi:hypothetical protein
MMSWNDLSISSDHIGELPGLRSPLRRAVDMAEMLKNRLKEKTGLGTRWVSDAQGRGREPDTLYLEVSNGPRGADTLPDQRYRVMSPTLLVGPGSGVSRCGRRRRNSVRECTGTNQEIPRHRIGCLSRPLERAAGHEAH